MSEGQGESKPTLPIPISDLEEVGSYVISSMKFFEQVDGAPNEIVNSGKKARAFLQKLAES